MDISRYTHQRDETGETTFLDGQPIFHVPQGCLDAQEVFDLASQEGKFLSGQWAIAAADGRTAQFETLSEVDDQKSKWGIGDDMCHIDYIV